MPSSGGISPLTCTHFDPNIFLIFSKSNFVHTSPTSLDLCETELINKPFVEIDRDISDNDWLSCRLQNNKFEGFGDASKLYEILEIFKKWVESETSK